MKDYHVLPTNDLHPHDETRQCLCRPTVTLETEGGAVVVHHSYDGREYAEVDNDTVTEEPN